MITKDSNFLRRYANFTSPIRKLRRQFSNGRTSLQRGRLAELLHITKEDLNKKKAEIVLRMLPDRDVTMELTGNEDPYNPAVTAFNKALAGEPLDRFHQKAFDEAVKPWLAKKD